MDREEARERAQKLVSKMTLNEKISQLRYNSPAIDRLGIPAYNWWGEALHGIARAGTATMFPQAVGMAAAFDEELMHEEGAVIADEGRAKYNAQSAFGDRDIYKGLTFWSPNINIFRDPRWGRGQETYGEDPYLTGVLGTAYVRGIQGDEEYLKAVACAKHFAAHSGPEAIRHSFNVIAGKKDMTETYLPAFRRLVQKAGVEEVMGTYNRVNGEPTCGSKTLIQDILREKWGFQGHFVSDCWAIRDFHEGHKITKNSAESAALALNSGCDLNCGCTFQHLREAWEQGLVSEERITEAAVRLMTTRFLLGLFDETEYDDIPYTQVECTEHLRTALRASQESIVLLKNDGILPLDIRKLHTIGVIGPNADSRKALIGNYHGTSSHYVTLLEGIQQYADAENRWRSQTGGEELRVLYSEGSDIQNRKVEPLAQDGDRLSEAVIVAENSDVVILGVGLNENLEGEEGDTGNSYASGDKTDLLLPPPQRDLLRAVQETGTPVVLCLMAGSAIDLSFADEYFAAVLQLWYPGALGGKAAAQILFGDVSPSGKLSITFYHNEDPLPEFTDYSMKGRTYRYLEHEPLYPFGYGLSYADIRVTKAELVRSGQEKGFPEKAYDAIGECAAGKRKAVADSADTADLPGKMAAGHRAEGFPPGCLQVNVTCENFSDTEADDVVEIYAKINGTPYAPPHPRLVGFGRVHLKGRGRKAVCIPLDEFTLLVVNENGEYVADGNGCTLYAGTSQPDGQSRRLTGKEPVKLELKF